jgi:hypothetical protein
MVRGLRRQVMIFWHGLVAWALAPGWFTKLVLTALSVWLLAWPFLKSGGLEKPIQYLALWIAVAIWKAYRELSPKNMQLLQRNYVARKLMLYQLIRDMERGPSMTADEIARFQREALHLIATYVRDHRLDTKGMQVFANLLVDDGAEHLRVVARDRLHREGSVRLKKEGSLAWAALVTGEPKLTGDVQADYPGTAEGKPYRSILVIPVRRGGDTLGVVSIDSSRKYHFDREMKNLVEYLAPYVALLAWTIRPVWGSVHVDGDRAATRKP